MDNENDNIEEEIVDVELDEDNSIDEIKAEAEALEAQIKELKKSKENDELKFNYTRRLEKAKQKLQDLKSDAPLGQPHKKEADVRDLITLAKQDIPENSEEAQILEKYKKAGLINDYASGLENVAIKAEFEALKAKRNAESIIDESDTENYLKSKKETIAEYKKSGNIPNDPKIQKDIALSNLEEMGF